MPDLNVTLIQASIEWENPEANLARFSKRLESIRERTGLVVLPEMFTTGFSMKAAALAEPMEGPSMEWMSARAGELGCPLTGSLIISEGQRFFNRMIWMRPDGTYSFYDKRHLFRMGDEHRHYSAGSERVIITLGRWRFCLQICYDLRFPVWSRSRGDYDALIYAANWPQPRRSAWITLLQARAIENQAYVIGVNRVGEDGAGKSYSGDSAVRDPKGELLSEIEGGLEAVETVPISLESLDSFREKFAVYRDADPFEIL
jgi:omega-amidase